MLLHPLLVTSVSLPAQRKAVTQTSSVYRLLVNSANPLPFSFLMREARFSGTTTSSEGAAAGLRAVEDSVTTEGQRR